jgi:hypothetical protein
MTAPRTIASRVTLLTLSEPSETPTWDNSQIEYDLRDFKQSKSFKSRLQPNVKCNYNECLQPGPVSYRAIVTTNRCAPAIRNKRLQPASRSR